MEKQDKEEATPNPEAGIPEMLAEARELVDGNNPMKALELVLQALRTANGGDESAVFRAIVEAKERHRKVVASPTRPGPNYVLLQPPPNMHLINEQNSILAEHEGDRKQIIIDATMDGSSFVCEQCGGVVAVARMEAHFRFWCGKELGDD